MSLQQEIIQRMKEFHPNKWVTPAIAIWKCPSTDGVAALNDLLNTRILEQKFVSGFMLVRYVPKINPPKLEIVSNNMSKHLHSTKWTAQQIAESVNMRIDEGSIKGDYLFAQDIPQRAVDEFQRVWDLHIDSPLIREAEFTRLYQAITAGF